MKKCHVLCVKCIDKDGSPKFTILLKFCTVVKSVFRKSKAYKLYEIIKMVQAVFSLFLRNRSLSEKVSKIYPFKVSTKLNLEKTFVKVRR